MAEDELLSRIRRIYASINASKEFNMSKLPAKVIKNDKVIGIFQDFSGELSTEEIQNIAHMVIHNIANLKDHLNRWAGINGKDKTKIQATFGASQPLKLIQDLSNNDKHGYPPRDGGYSGLAPKLIKVGRVMRMTTRAKAGSSVVMTFGPGGVPQISGDGTACAVITGEIVDKDGKAIGDLFEFEKTALTAWESLLSEYDIQIPITGA